MESVVMYKLYVRNLWICITEKFCLQYIVYRYNNYEVNDTCQTKKEWTIAVARPDINIKVTTYDITNLHFNVLRIKGIQKS